MKNRTRDENLTSYGMYDSIKSTFLYNSKSRLGYTTNDAYLSQERLPTNSNNFKSMVDSRESAHKDLRSGPGSRNFYSNISNQENYDPATSYKTYNTSELSTSFGPKASIKVKILKLH